MDLTDPVVLSTIAQTTVLTLTLVIFILSFRSQNKAYKEGAYQQVLGDYTDSIRMLVEKPELSKFSAEIARIATPSSKAVSRSPEETVVRNFIPLQYGMFERIHLLYRKKWIDKETWRQWSAFLEAVAIHPMFREVHQSSEGMFDKPFQDYVSTVLNRKS